MAPWLLAVAFAWAGAPADAIRAAVAERAGVPGTEVEVTGIGALPGAPADADWAVALPSTGPITGDVRVVIRAGTARYALVPHVVVWRTLPVSATPARADERIAITTARVSSDRLRGASPVDATHAWAARVDLAAGDPVTTANARAFPDAERGTNVHIVAGNGGFTVTAPGQLLDDGFIGGRVAVLNLATHTVLNGTYRGDAVVALEQP